MRVRIATRTSPLARWQADHVAAALRAVAPQVGVEIVGVSTEGDRRTDIPLSEIGGKGVFATEVQAAVLDGRADVAVHSGKDLPARTPDGLVIAAVPERGDPRDALVGSRLIDLRPDAVVATGSARRRLQLGHLRPDLRFEDLRGNMATRLEKAARYDAIVVAAVALERLGLAERISDVLPASLVVPQVAQGALVVECRTDDEQLRSRLALIEDAPSRRAVDAERAFLAELGGDCSLPAGAHAVPLDDGVLRVQGVLGEQVADGSMRMHHTTEIGDDPTTVGNALARRLLESTGVARPGRPGDVNGSECPP